MRQILLLLLTLALALPQGVGAPALRHGLQFSKLPASWDEGLPLGNGLVGALVWERGGRLRLSLDRADLWDLSPIAEFSRPEFRFSWVVEQVRKGEYKPVQDLFDLPYDRDAAPTKIPAAALEFGPGSAGEIVNARLSIDSAVALIEWRNGARGFAFVHPTLPIGWFRITRAPEGFAPEIIPAPYSSEHGTKGPENPTVDGQDLRRLGYPPPRLERAPGLLRLRQKGRDVSYEISVRWERDSSGTITGVWGISAEPSYARPSRSSTLETARGLKRGFDRDFADNRARWRRFWGQSSVELPDPVLERQWYLDTYKFGAASRRGAPPITLQAVWTADNGKLPPWRGDFHHDLNTQLSYWPCYSGNRLEEGQAFLDWLWRVRPAAERYTKRYFGTTGLNVPGVTTLTGEPIGGWIQYSLSPTVSAWLAHHFYLHWRYSMDREFLRARAYPWIRETARHLEELSSIGADRFRRLPLSSSPEINDNRIDAWFSEMTNYDLALVRWLFGAAAECADELRLTAEAQHWRSILDQWPPLARESPEGKLLVAPGIPLRESHRHFSHLMAIHPLGLVDPANGERDVRTINASLEDLRRLGTDLWVGYSFSWLGSFYARGGDGERAAEALRTFAACFVLPNSFHVNGDQSGTGKSKFTYRPFTLEGNFAFAQGIQEMLIQSHTGMVRLFPAIPESWRDVGFTSLRAEGAFLISARREAGRTRSVRVLSERGGILRLADPFPGAGWNCEGIPRDRIKRENGLLVVSCRRGEAFTLSRGALR